MLFINIIVPVFIIIGCGWGLGRFFKVEQGPLATSSLYLFAPALVLSALLKHPISSDHALDVLLFMMIYMVIMLLLAKLACRLMAIDESCKPALTLTTAMMNIGNFGLPLSYFAFGEQGVPIAVLVFVMFNLPLGSLAIVIAQGKGAKLSTAIVNSSKIPIFHAVIIALIFNLLHIELPLFLLRPLDIIGQVAVPLMLVILGIQISKTQWIIPIRFMTAACSLRLVIAPVIAWGTCHVLNIDGLYRDILILQTSTPSAVLPLLYALRFNTRPDLVASTIMVTTLLSAASLTVLLYLLPFLP